MQDLITTERLVLRRYRPEDAEDLAAALSDYEVARWLSGVPSPYDETDAMQFITGEVGNVKDAYAITKDGRLIGGISLKGALGYWLKQTFWGQGFATEAANAILAAFFETNEGAVESSYFKGNEKSANVLYKLGFVDDGDGFFDTVSWGRKARRNVILTKSDWETAAKAQSS